MHNYPIVLLTRGSGIRNYDVNGASSTPGPNAPLSDGCGTSDQPQANAVAAFKQWTAAGFPAGQLLLGLPTYGYVSQSTATTLTGSFQLQGGQKTDTNPVATKPHPRERRNPKNKAAASGGDLSSWFGQQIPFNAIVSGGAIKKSNGVYISDNGYTYGKRLPGQSPFSLDLAIIAAWDDCSDTPVRTSVDNFIMLGSPILSYDPSLFTIRPGTLS